MRPLRLTMQAFGPYAGREVVDFRAAVAHGLFGIYGPTGAGKSTIFSAMTFALFGEAARPEQEIASLRSDLADPAMPTEVELVFELAGRTYVVRRRPDQMRPKQRGEGETRDPHEASLFDATGIALEAIVETNTGKPLAERKTGAVRSAVGELLGYGPEQFRQIVLLPQGRFEAFLAAKTDERMKILRDLFDVSLYRRLAERMKRDADAATRSVHDERLVYDRRLKEAGFDALGGVTEAIETAAGALAEATRQEDITRNAATEALKAREAAERSAERFAAAEAATAVLKTLQARAGEIAAVEARLHGARRAEALKDVEDHATAAAEESRQAISARQNADAAAGKAAEQAEAAARALAGEKARAAEMAGLERQVQQLEAHGRTLADAATLEASAHEAKGALVAAESAWQSASNDHAALVKALAGADESVALARVDAEARQRLGHRKVELETALKAADAFDKARNALAEAQTAVGRCEATDHATSAQLETARRELAAVEDDIAAAQALKLAAELQPDFPCPVCGSCSHPAPASGTVEHAGLSRRLREAREALQAVETAHRANATDLAAARATRDARRDRLDELAAPATPAAGIANLLAALAREIEALGPARDVAAAEARCRTLKTALATAETKRESDRAARDRAREASVSAEVRLQQALSAVPEALRSSEALAGVLGEARTTLEMLRSALEAAERREREAREALIGARKDAEAAATAQQRAHDRAARAEANFSSRLAASGFENAAYRTYKAAIATIEADQAAVEGHRRALAAAEEAARQAQAAIAGEERPDVAGFRTAEAEAAEALRLATEARIHRESEHQRLVALEASLAKAGREIDELEARTAPLRDLARLFNAQNMHKLDLETFAIGAMFDEVLRAANQRLGPMTAGRYTLEREVEVGSGRSRSGLGIRVFDTHTGKSRPTATLSGGETFIAALALALGLSDVVESTSGKVRLDTIFIDEGFGSLDAENEAGTLEMVLDVLTSLAGRNRAIGLISHVPLVREAVPNGFVIRQQSTTGSRVEVRRAA